MIRKQYLIFIGLLPILFMILNCSVKSQQVSFKTIEFGYFEYDTITKKSKIYLYSKIDNSGELTTYFYNSSFDTTYYFTKKVSENLKLNLTKTFNKKNKLAKYIDTSSLKDDGIFMADYEFFLVTYKDNSVDSFCTSTCFTTEKFNRTRDSLNPYFFDEDGRILIPRFNIPKEFKKMLEIAYHNAKWLPTKGSLPPIKF